VRILFLSFYYRPDLCAGSFRATPLVDALVKLAPAGSQIDVVTTQPNRYHSFNAESPQTEEHPGLSIFRIALPKHQSGMLDQSKAFLTFSRAALGKVSGRDYDIVVATSSRLMTAVLGAWIAMRKKAKLYLDIRDIFVDTIRDVLPRHFAAIAAPLFSLMERFAVKQADKVNLVSAGFLPYFTARYPVQRYSCFTNGVDDEFVSVVPGAAAVPAQPSNGRPLTVLYAGNVGEGQGLHAIIPALACRMQGRIRFRIIGDGGRKRALAAALHELSVTTVELLPPVDREALLREYAQADVLFVHLNDCAAFEKVLPSKLFEYAALGKPVWAGVAGYAAQFVAAEISNAAVFAPCDVEGAALAFETLDISVTPRTDFVARYARATISRDMAADIVAMANAHG
jgi:glycosyltransferase involved in cell wall biosynthesis